MRFVTIDSSVAVKWIFPERLHEQHMTHALQLLKLIEHESIKIIQPVHWLVEVAAVVVRIQPQISKRTIQFLEAMKFPIADEIEIYHIACELAERFNHHLFDTLYHAVAIYKNAQFITADEKYYKKTHKQGHVIRLADFSIFD